MILRNLQLAALATSLFAASALAQTSFPEIEPNTNKAEADANGVITLVAGDSLTGSTTGTITTALSTLATSVDQFRIKTGALPLGIYKHELVITTTGTAGHTGTIRGLNQTGTAGVGGTAGTTDATVQTSSTTHTPARKNTWYGFGKQEELYYRVTGTTATTAPYISTLTTTPVTPTVIAPSFEAANPITFTTIGQTTADTMLHIYDSTLSPVVGASNDDEGPGGTTLQSRLIRTLAPGTYYLNVSSSNTAWNLVAPNDEDFFSNLMDFPDVIVRASTTITALDWDFKISASNGFLAVTNAFPAGVGFEQTWFQFTVANGAPLIIPPAPANDNCAAAISIGTGGTFLGTTAGGTNDGAASCDPGVGTAKDVWYSYTNTNATVRVLSANTCGTTAIDTCLSVYDGCGGLELACNDDCGGFPCAATSSCLSGIVVNPGQTVLIRVSDKGLSSIVQGDFTLVTSANVPPPSNDGCATPVAMGAPGNYPIDTTGATTGAEGQAEALCLFAAQTAINKDVWYTYTPTTNGTVTVSTCGLITTGTSQDSKIAVYAGAACPAAGTAVACNDDATCTGFSGLNATVTFTAVCGTTYLFQVGSFGATANIIGNVSVAETGGASCSTPVTYYCFGDGTGTACPCANSGVAGNGCANSINANGGNLAASGIASIAADTFVISATGVPNGPGLYFQGTTQLNGGLGNAFGDGLRCAGGAIIRLGIVTGVANASTYPSPNPPAVNAIPISLKGLNAAGNVRNYQLWYRDSGVFCTASVFNLTNAVNMTWTP